MILIEGPDGAGKTTLAQELAKRLALQYKHWGAPTTDRKEYYSRVVKSVQFFSKTYIQDRSPLVSEPIYCEANINKTPMLSWDVSRELLQGAIHHGLIVVWCNPKTLHQTKKSYDKFIFSDENLNAVRFTYMKYFAEIEGVLYYDREGLTLKDLENKILLKFRNSQGA